MPTRFLSARQAAQMLGVSKAYACRLFSQGIIPAEKVDTDWIVERKSVQWYLDDKSRIPVYYRQTDGWTQEDFYFMFRSLDKMMNDRRGRYDKELAAIDCNRLNAEARAILSAQKGYERFSNLAQTKYAQPVAPPIVLSTYPSPGSFPTFEEMGLIL